MIQTVASLKEVLLRLLEKYKINIYTNTEVTGIKSDKVFCRNLLTGNLLDFSVDNISICVGMEPKIIGIEYLEQVITIGDAFRTDNVMNAVWTAYRKARLI